jgi:hypothetical protein
VIGPLVGTVHAGDDLDQSRLTRPVLADQRVDLSIPQLEINPIQGLHAGEPLANPP